MKYALYVTWDVIMEALRRKWFIGMAAALTLFLVVMAASLELEVIDGALAASKLFGDDLNPNLIQSVDVALRPVFRAFSIGLFWCGLLFGTFASADFAPRLLAPGRIEHLLSLPIPRWALLTGTFVGVNLVMLAISLYGAIGITAVLGIKTGLFMPRLILSGVWGGVAFSSVYGAMLLSSLFIRSAAAGGLVGMVVIVAGSIASVRTQAMEAISSDIAREVFSVASYALPPLLTASRNAGNYVAHEPISLLQLGLQLMGMIIFGLAAVAFGLIRFEKMDF